MSHLDIHVPLRWSDLDAYQHVNNAATVRLLEEARVEAFWAPSDEEQELGARKHPTAIPAFGVNGALMTLVASQHLEYLRPIPYRREGVVVRLWLSRLGGASMDIDYVILGRDDDAGLKPYVRARTVMVMVDRATHQPSRMGEEARRQMEPWLGEPLAFRS